MHAEPEPHGSSLKLRIASWSMAGALLVILVVRTSPAALWAAIVSAEPGWLLAAGVLSLASEIVIASHKYQRILSALGASLSWSETVVLRMGSYPVRNLLPLKSGELLRVSYLKRRHGLSMKRGAFAALLDALTNATVLGLFVAVGLGLRGLDGLAVLVAITGGMALVLTTILSQRHQVGAQVGAWFSRGLARRLGDHAIPGALAWRTARGIAGWTLVTVAVDLVAYGLVLRAFHVPVPLARMTLFLPMIDLAAGLPVTPMGVGVRETAVTLMLSPYGSPEVLLAVALVASAVLKLLPTFAGIPFLRPLLARLLDDDNDANGPQDPRPPALGER